MSFTWYLNYFNNLWLTRGFEIILLSCVVLILLFALYNWVSGKNGSWSSYYFKEDAVSNELTPKVARKPFESKGEIECRRVLEAYFKKAFPKCRPSFLNNPVTGGKNNLEIDCFNAPLKIGCEYDGEAHYKYIPHFHRSKDAFENQKYRDYMKDQMCVQNGIKLIRVPYTIKEKDIEEFITIKLKQIGY